MSWLAGCVAKAQLNAIYMPCDAKAWTVLLFSWGSDSVIVRALTEFLYFKDTSRNDFSKIKGR